MQFSLRSLLIAALLCGAAAGLLQREREFCRRNERSLLTLTQRGFKVETIPGRFAWASNLLGVKSVLVVTGVEAHGYSHSYNGIVDEDLANLVGLSRLTTINVGNTIISDRGLKHLRGLPSLTSLNLDGTSVTDQGLAQLPNLKELSDLNLAHTAITDAGIEHIVELTQLRTLDVSSTRLSEQELMRLQAALPNCEVSW